VWSEHRYVVIDVEGNGHQPPDLVELGVVPIVAGVIGQPTAWLFRPDQPITAMARRVHGISNEMVADAPVFASLEAAVQAHLDGAVLVAHNAAIDLDVLRRKLPGFTPTEVIDTLKLSRQLLPGLPSHRLGSLVTALDLGTGDQSA
jgi:exodeoxyribonuclease X